ncbi:MAG TPA: PAS domain-containing protein [Rhodocyclaceae bacterium]|nr:PAS domain-containing protein [Rhodocyclaceae bacterium]
MRTNLPITQTERFLVSGKPIVTKTDLQSTITYANESFVEISGFTHAQLIGQSHNLVRHPDMPPQAFADMWRTVKAGNPWRGMVKNRCVNGDFYWVDAYVTPITENGEPVGYMSVRSAPSRAAVAEAEALYAAVREGRTPFPQTPLIGQSGSKRLQAWIMPTLAAVSCLASAFTSGALAFLFGGAGAVLVLAYAAWVTHDQSRIAAAILKALQAIDEGRLDRPVPMHKGAFATTFSLLESTRIHLRAVFADVLLSAQNVETRDRSGYHRA